MISLILAIVSSCLVAVNLIFVGVNLNSAGKKKKMMIVMEMLSFDLKEDAEPILSMGKKYLKKPIPITAIQIECAFEVKTLEGLMKGKKGDYLIEGIKGELYICDKEIFEESYKMIE